MPRGAAAAEVARQSSPLTIAPSSRSSTAVGKVDSPRVTAAAAPSSPSTCCVVVLVVVEVVEGTVAAMVAVEAEEEGGGRRLTCKRKTSAPTGGVASVHSRRRRSHSPSLPGMLAQRSAARGSEAAHRALETSHASGSQSRPSIGWGAPPGAPGWAS